LDDLFADPRAVLVIANITIVEMYSALSRKRRNREIADADFRLAIAVFEADIRAGTFHFLEVGNAHIQRSTALIVQHDGLRAYDALQLAMGLDLEPLNSVFVAADDVLCEAAEVEGLTVLNPAANQ
jgi:predicted nucleic acid-binding protein